MRYSSEERRYSGALAVLLAVAGIVALTIGSLAASTGKAWAQEVDEETMTICVDGETMEDVTAEELAEIEEFTEGACEEEEATAAGAEGARVIEEGGEGESIAEEDTSGEEAAEDASEEDASEDSFVPDPNPSLFPNGFDTPQQQPLELPSIGAADDSTLEDDDVSALEGETATEEVAALPSSGSGGFGGGGAAPWGALLGVALLGLGGATALITRTGLR